MNALYKNCIFNVVDAMGCEVTLDGNAVEPFDVWIDDRELIIEPTDDQVADAINLSQWYGVGEARTAALRRMLRSR